MRRLFPFLVIVSILLFSCSRSDFRVSGAGFSHTDGGVRIKAFVEEGEEDEKYSFILSSPDKDLVWKGDFSYDKGRLSSDVLLITPGSSMPKGEYTLLIHSTNGSDLEEKISL